MKKLLCILLSLWINIANFTIDPYTKTGHDQFSELELEETGILLVNMSNKYIDCEYGRIKPSFFGWKTRVLNKYLKSNYIGTIIFSRSNKTREAFVFNYNVKNVSYDSRSFAIKGSVSIKGAIKNTNGKKSVEGNGGLDITAEYKHEWSEQYTEDMGMKVVIYPNKKVTLRVVGEARVSNGVGKYYIFWICSKKAAWEVVDIVTSYFELVEENA